MTSRCTLNVQYWCVTLTQMISFNFTLQLSGYSWRTKSQNPTPCNRINYNKHFYKNIFFCNVLFFHGVFLSHYMCIYDLFKFHHYISPLYQMNKNVIALNSSCSATVCNRMVYPQTFGWVYFYYVYSCFVYFKIILLF